MQYRYVPYILGFLGAVAPVAPASAQSIQQDAIGQIRELLPLVCGEYQSNGSSESLKISGDAEIKLDGLMKRLAALGIKGATEFDSDEYVGVLREEVGQELKSVRECRLKVFQDLKGLISTGKVSNSIDNQGNGNTNIIGNGNSVNVNK